MEAIQSGEKAVSQGMEQFVGLNQHSLSQKNLSFVLAAICFSI